MAISSQRFKFLDRETNIGTSDFLSLSDNSVYTAVVESADTVVEAIREGESKLTAMEKSINDLMDKVSSASKDIMQKIKNALDSAIDKIMNMKLPKFVTKILDSLKGLDLGGVKGFFKDLLRVGSAFLCNNLDFLKSFMLGYSLTENILSGLLIGLLLSWLDRYCKGFSKQEVLAASNKTKLGMLFSNDGITLTPDTVLGKFSNVYADFVRYSRPYTPNLPPSTALFLENILSGKGKESVRSIRNAEVSSSKRKEYIAFLDEQLSNYVPNTPEYNLVSTTRAELINTPLIAEERIEKATQYSNLNDALGSIALNLKGVDLREVNTFALTETEAKLLTKLEEFKTTVEQDKDIQTRDHETGSFTDFNFNTLLPEPEADEIEYLDKLPGLEDSHRYNGLHPTTEVFTENNLPNSTRLLPEEKPMSNKPTASKDAITPIGVVAITNTPPTNPILGSVYTTTPSGSSIQPSKTLNVKPDTTTTPSVPNLSNRLEERSESIEQSTDKKETSYIPTPVIPGSCYA